MDHVGGSGGRFGCVLGVEWHDRVCGLKRHGRFWSLSAQRERLIQASPLGGRMSTRGSKKVWASRDRQ